MPGDADNVDMNEPAYRAAEQRLWASLGVQPTERWVDLPRHATRIRIQEVGDGPPVVFIHGANTAGASWASLASRLPDLHCLVIDRPGAGLSPPLPRRIDRSSLAEIADTIVTDILDVLGLPSAHLVATSLGGYVALRAAAAAPDRFDRMVQFSWPVGAPTPHVPLTLRMMAIPGAGRIAAAMPVNENGVRMLFRRLGNAKALEDGRITQADIDAYLALLRHTDTMRNDLAPARALVSPIGGVRGLDLSDDILGRIRCPTLFIWGAHDTFGGVDVARRLVPRIPGATLEVMPDAGHSPWLDDVDHCATRVATFLSGGHGGLTRPQTCWSKRTGLPSGSTTMKLAGPVVDSSASCSNPMPAARRVRWMSRTSVKDASGCAAASQPGLKVRMFRSNIPWNRPMIAGPLVRISHPWLASPPIVVKPRVS